VIDDYTIRVNLKEPSGAFMSVLAIEPGSMMSPTAIEERGEDFHRQPVGTGPFVLRTWTSNQVEADRFEDYWGQDEAGAQLPYLDNVVVRVISNTAVKIVELRGGSLHLGDSIQVRDYEQIERDPELVLMDTIQGTTQYMAFNLTQPPFDNQDLRAAVALAINRDALERAISRGHGIPLKGNKPPSSLAFSEDVTGHEHNPEKAREHYAASGHSGTLTLSVIQRDPDTQIAQIVQSMLREVGIELRIEVMERQAWLDKVLGRTYELGILRATVPRPDPDISFSTYWGREARQDFSGIHSPVLHDLIDQARAEIDPEGRRALYGEAQQYINDNYFQTYFLWRPNSEVRRAELQGMESEFAAPGAMPACGSSNRAPSG
jgi:peptide/nickel transport system substrate-binding protein